jgi:uncharacterized protein (TIGR00369 family)
MKMDTTPERLEFLARDYSQGFIADLGIMVAQYDPGYLESCLEILPRHRQQDQYIHAGVLATMADHTAGYAAYSLVDDDFRILTIEFKINFFRPAYGQVLICKSRILHQGGKVLVGESEVYDQQPEGNILAAKATITLMSVHKSRIKKVLSEVI